MACFTTKLSLIILIIVLYLSPVMAAFRLPLGNLVLQNEASVNYNQRLVLSTDFVDVLASLSSEKTQLSLRLLFDAVHEDILRDVKNFTTNISDGVIMVKYEEENATLEQMLKSSALGTTLTIPLCTPFNILTVFRMIRRKRLESLFARWLLVVSNSKALNEITNGLEGLLHEGIRISLIYKDSAGRSFVFSSRVDDEGVVRLISEGNGVRTLSKTWEHDLRSKVLADDRRIYLDMQGREMRVAANDFEGFFGVDQKERLLGIDGAIVETLSYALNFTYKIVRPPDGAWGNPLPDGTVSGVIGMAARWEVAFSICAIAHTELRDTVVDFTIPYFIEPLALFSRAPQEKNKVLAILSPFSLEVWITLLAAVLAIGPILSLQSLVSIWLLGEKSDVGLQQFSFNMFRTLMIQGNRLKAHRWTQRILFFSWYLFCIIVSALYSGMLTAVLAIPAFEEPIDSLTDLPRAVKNGFSLGILKDTANEMLFREATSGIFRETWLLFDHKNPEESFVFRPEVGIQRAMTRKYVFIGFKISNELMVFKIGRRRFHIGRENVFPLIIAIACPPGAPYKKDFDLMLLRIIEGGLISKWRADEFTKVSLQTSSDTEDVSSKTYAINLVHLQAAFFVVVLGIFLATMVLATENILSHVW